MLFLELLKEHLTTPPIVTGGLSDDNQKLIMEALARFWIELYRMTYVRVDCLIRNSGSSAAVVGPLISFHFASPTLHSPSVHSDQMQIATLL